MKNILSYAMLMVSIALPLSARSIADSSSRQVQHHRRQARGATTRDQHHSLQRRAPKPTRVTQTVATWDLAYLDLATGDSKLYEISKDGGDTAKSQRFVGTMDLGSTGLASCTALAIAGKSGAMLGHFPPQFCTYLENGKIDSNWAGKAKRMKEKLDKVLSVHKAALSGGQIVIVRGPDTRGTQSSDELTKILRASGISGTPLIEKSVAAYNHAARKVVITRGAARAIITVDGRQV